MTDVAIPTPTDVAGLEVNGAASLVATAEQAILALSDSEWDDVPDGHLGESSVGLPRLLINRKVDGGFIDELSPDAAPFREVDVFWLADTTTRAWWPEGFGKGEKIPACRSHDGRVPDPSSPSIQAETCAACPHSKWLTDSSGNRSQDCKESIEVLTVVAGLKRLSLIRFGGMAVKPVNAFLRVVRGRVPKRPPMAYVTHIELIEEKTDNGTFLIPKFSVIDELTRAQAQPLVELQAAKVPEWQQFVATEVNEGRTDDGNDTEGGGNDFPAEEWPGDGSEEVF